jgi:hypothetical protein
VSRSCRCKRIGATFRVGSNVLHDRGRLAVVDDPRVKAVAARYAGRPAFNKTQFNDAGTST